MTDATTRTLTLATIALGATLLLAAGPGCQTTPDSREHGCTGTSASMDGRDYCAYQRSEITETGFDCPASHPHRHDAGDAVVCAKSDEKMPDDHKQRVQDEMDGKPGDDDNSGEWTPADTGPSSDDDGWEADSSGPSTADGSDTEPEDDTEGLARPNQCQDPDYQDYGTPEQFPIPWTIADDGGMSVPEAFDATWSGVETLDASVQFDCPPTAGDLALNCTTQKALVLERSTDGTTQTIKVAVSIPLGDIDFPSSGTTVSVVQKDGQFSIASNDRSILAIVSETEPDQNLPEFSHTHGPFTVSVDLTDLADPDSAFCVTRHACPRVYRLEPLTVEASQTLTLDPGSTQVLQTPADNSYDFWHLVSRQRGPVQGWEQTVCADVGQVWTAFAFAHRASN